MKSARESGFSLVEVLVSMVVLLVGLLGLLGTMTLSQRSELESYQRRQALLLLDDMVNRIRANGRAGTVRYADCYVISTDPTTNFVGTGHSTNYGTPVCDSAVVGATAYALAQQDLRDWNNALLGAAETSGGSSIGAMIGARGCITGSSGTYKVSIAWQGLAKMGSPPTADNCGQSLYGNEGMRRVISTSVTIATLR